MSNLKVKLLSLGRPLPRHIYNFIQTTKTPGTMYEFHRTSSMNNNPYCIPGGFAQKNRKMRTVYFFQTIDGRDFQLRFRSAFRSGAGGASEI